MMKALCMWFFAHIATSQAFYSVNYIASSNHPQVVGQVGSFKNAPDADHVADIYTRLGGLNPLLREDTVNLPAIDVLTPRTQIPVILEVNGGKLPSTISPVMTASAFVDDGRGPSLDNVLTVLKAHGISVESHQIDARGDNSAQVAQWIQSQKSPVVILHHETPAAHHFVHRSLSSTNSTVTPLTEFQISQYQIVLWTAVMMVLLVLSAICSIINMEVIPDSLLFAKFQSTRTHKND